MARPQAASICASRLSQSVTKETVNNSWARPVRGLMYWMLFSYLLTRGANQDSPPPARRDTIAQLLPGIDGRFLFSEPLLPAVGLIFSLGSQMQVLSEVRDAKGGTGRV